MTRPIVMVTGGAPGVGKSSLVRWITQRLPAASAFDEAEILSRPEFAEIVTVWAGGGIPSLPSLTAAASAYLDRCRSEDAPVFVQDALLPYLPSLYAWGYEDEQIRTWFGHLAEISGGFQLFQIHLSGDPTLAIARAVAREGGQWLDWMVERARSWVGGDEVVDLDSLGFLFNSWDARSRRLLRAAPWPILKVDADRGQSDVESQVDAFLAPALDNRVRPHPVP